MRSAFLIPASAFFVSIARDSASMRSIPAMIESVGSSLRSVVIGQIYPYTVGESRYLGKSLQSPRIEFAARRRCLRMLAYRNPLTHPQDPSQGPG